MGQFVMLMPLLHSFLTQHCTAWLMRHIILSYIPIYIYIYTTRINFIILPMWMYHY
jgi:hypothetical protein